jgi:hypothetical protein
MIVDRRVFPVKPGCEAAVANLIKESIDGDPSYTRCYRIYTPNISSYGVVVVEWEYEDLQEMQASWDAWYASPASSAFLEKWRELTERGGEGEVWNLVAQR